MLVERARVGTATLRQHETRILDDGNTLAVAMALGPPRLWSYLTDAALAGFAEGIGLSDGRASTRMHSGLLVAQRFVRVRVEALVERRPPDVALLAVSLEGSLLHVVGVGPLRAYVHRRKQLRRLGASQDSSDGVLRSTPAWCAEPVEKDDLVLVASLSASSDGALQEVRTLLEGARHAAVEEVLRTLTTSAKRLGMPCAVAGFRIGSD